MAVTTIYRNARLFRELSRPADIVQHLGPNWYATIMGTGIVANAAFALPGQVGLLLEFSRWLWLADAVALLALTGAWILHVLFARQNALGHLKNPLMAQFFGAPPMALMTVGTGAATEGRYFLHGAGLGLDWILWVTGTILGLMVAAAVPAAMASRYSMGPEDTFASWLMPVVPPMVAAGTAGPILASAPAALRVDLLYGCYAMFGAALVMSLVVLTLFWARLVAGAEVPAHMVPTMWIVLGPLGQSITAVTGLGHEAGVLGPSIGKAFGVMGVIYGVPVLGFALLWAAIAAAVTTVRASKGIPFGLTWWSFTFPVGTVVTGAIGLFRSTGSPLFAGVATAGYGILFLAWALVAARTVAASVSGAIFLPADLAVGDKETDYQAPVLATTGTAAKVA